MKEKTITIKTNEISQRQYSTLLLELNIMKQQWKSYGVDIQLSAPSLKKIIALGTSNVSDKKDPDELANLWNKTKDPKYKKLWYKTRGERMDNNIKRRNVSTDSSHKTDDGWNSVDKRR